MVEPDSRQSCALSSSWSSCEGMPRGRWRVANAPQAGAPSARCLRGDQPVIASRSVMGPATVMTANRTDLRSVLVPTSSPRSPREVSLRSDGGRQVRACSRPAVDRPKSGSPKETARFAQHRSSHRSTSADARHRPAGPQRTRQPTPGPQ